MGDEVGILNIPSLAPGQTKIIEFEWNVPNPEDYININSNPWHFCLLARIDSNDDPMTFQEGDFITTNVKNNNNIAWKNTTVVDIIPDAPSPVAIGGVVAVGNPFNQQHSFNLEFVRENNDLGKAIYDEAEVTIEMDSILFNAWERGGKTGDNYKATASPAKKIVTNDNALIENIQFNPNEIGTVYVTFNFLTKEITEKTKFVYNVIQRDATTNEVIGGETYIISKKPRDIFIADAGNDEEIEKNETVTLNAGQINENATYNWYDPDGNLIYTGTELTISPEITKTYKLEIVSNIDGFKDYDEVEVTVSPYKIESLIPNPASNMVTINYTADEATSAYVMIVNNTTGSSDNYIIDTSLATIDVDLSIYQEGLYSVILVCDGEIQSSKTLVKN